jgi:hypothetical protein
LALGGRVVDLRRSDFEELDPLDLISAARTGED